MNSQLDQFQALVSFSFSCTHPMWCYLRAGKVTLCWRLFINPHPSKLCRPNYPEILLKQAWAILRCLGKSASHQPDQPMAVPEPWATFFPDKWDLLVRSNRKWPQLSQLHATFPFPSLPSFADTPCPFCSRVILKTCGGDIPCSCWFCGMPAFFQHYRAGAM